MRALVIEDAPDIRFLFRQTLQSGGFEVDEAEDGKHALEMLQNGMVPDLVVLDVQMPDVDGWSVLASIRSDERTADVPVLMCTVKARGDDIIRGWEAGCDGYVVKPFDIDVLLQEVRAVLDRDPAERRRLRAQALARQREAAKER